jgi:signal transduction histidine kinase/ABC-type nitrate/sulfonate/bicarbonate transport system substrate-binding protein
MKSMFNTKTCQMVYYYSFFFFIILWNTTCYANETVRLQLKYKHQFQFAGYYVAIEKGYYDTEGLDVILLEGKPSIYEVEEVISGRTQFGVGTSDIVLSRLGGKPVVILANIFQHSPVALLTKKESGLRSPQDLYGKRVMMAQGEKSAELQAMFLNEGVSVDNITIVKPSWNLDDLINGRVDALSAYVSSEPYKLELKNIPYTIIGPSNYGIDFYGDNLFTSEDQIKKYPEQVAAFTRASLKGWKYALANPDETADLILRKYGSIRPDLNKERLLNEAKTYQKLILPNFVEVGHVNPGRWRHIADSYQKLGMIDKDYSMEGFIHNPDRTPDYTWLKWVAGISVVLILLVSGGAIILIIFNRKLAIEVDERKRAEEELSKLNLELEDRVKKRTEQLQKEVIERKQAEEKLRHNKEMLQMVFDGISDPLVMLGKNLEIGLLNKAASVYYHVGQKEVIGKPCHQAFRGTSSKCENCKVPAAVSNHQDLMLEREGFMDSNRIEQVVVYSVADKNNDESVAIIRISDVTNEKMLQKHIVQSEKLSALGFLVSGVAHEINNPNNFISFNIPILREYLNEIIPIIDNYAKEHENFELFGMIYPEFRKDVFKLVDNVENGSRRINIAVSNLSEISRTKEKTKIDCIDVKESIEKSVSICRSKINRMVKSFEVDIPDDLPMIFTDSETLETVVINLLINAVQAVDKENSWIRLNVTLDDSSQNDLIIEVRDNGCGLDEEIKNHIFDPFFTTKSPGEGTGLGLTLCHNSIEKCGGRIVVKSVPGEGSTFKVTLPNNDTKNRKYRA